MAGPTRMHAAAAAAAALLAVVLAAVPALAEDYPRILRVDASHSPEISVTAVLPPSLAGRPLPASAVRVTGGGTSLTPSRVAPLSAGGLRLVLVLDQAVRPDLVAAQQGAIREILIRLPVGTEVAMVATGAEPKLLAPLSTDRAGAVAALLDLDPATDAPADRITTGLDLARRQLLPARPGDAVVAVDGRPTTKEVPPAVSELARAGTAVYAVTFGDIPAGYLDGLPGRTGGRAVHVPAANRLLAAYDAVVTEISNRYRIDFTSPSSGRQALELVVATDGFHGTTAFVVDRPGRASPSVGRTRELARSRHLGVTLPALVTVVALSSFVLRRRASRAY